MRRDMTGQKRSTGTGNGGPIDSLLQMLTDLSGKIASFFAKPKKSTQPAGNAEKRQHSAAAEETDSVTIGGDDAEMQYSDAGEDMLSAQRSEIARWLKTVKFRPRLFAGVDEADVWKKIRQLNRMYDDALVAERARYDALLEHYGIMPGEMEYDGEYPEEYSEEYDEYAEYDEYEADADYSDQDEYESDPDGEEYFDEDEYSDD